MSLKIILGSVATGIILVIGAYFIISPKVSDAPSEATTNTAPADIEGQDPAEEAQEGVVEKVKEAVTPTAQPVTPVANTTATAPKTTVTPTAAEPAPAPVVAPAPEPISKPTPTGFTKEEVATHADDVSCWTIINGSVYDVTVYIPKHPGGEKRILKMCGTDGTSAFENEHGGQSKPETILAKYRLGALVQ